MCGWILLSILLLLALLVQTIRITDMKGDIFLKKSRIELIERDEKNLVDRLKAMTVNRDDMHDLYEAACEEKEELNKQLSRLKDDLDECKTLNCRSVSDKDKTIRHLTDSLSRQQDAVKQLKGRVNELERCQLLKSHARLSDGLGELIRFIAANQWIMENNKSLAEAVASVSEVAEAITERER